MLKHWKDIHFSLDLIRSAVNLQDILKLIDETKFSKSDIKKAIYRYEKFWLPLCDKMSEDKLDLFKYYPPLDVAWIWHCHLLSPTEYKKDLENNFGKIFPRSCLSYNDILFKQQKTANLWQNETGLSFEHNKPNSIDASYKQFKSKFSYDLFESSERQKSFYYQVFLPHYRSSKFLKLALKRYKKFLFLKKQNPELFIVPCYAIDIIWHSHQLHPIEYNKDCVKIMGKIFPHDDSVNDRSEGSKLVNSFSQTMQLWKSSFKEELFFSGGMYRGPVPNESEYIKNDDLKLDNYFDRVFLLLIDELSFENEKIAVSISLLMEKTESKESREILIDEHEKKFGIELNENEYNNFKLRFRLKKNKIDKEEYRIYIENLPLFYF